MSKSPNVPTTDWLAAWLWLWLGSWAGDNTENAFATRTVNLETDKSHSEKRALVHSEQKKLKGFKLTVQWQPGVSQARTREYEEAMTKSEVQTTPGLCLHLALSAAIYENSFSGKFPSILCCCSLSLPHLLSLSVCESFLTTEKLCKLWLNNGRQCCDFSVPISMI